MTTLREEFARKSASDFMERHFAHLRDGRKEYTEAEVRNIMLAMQAEIDSAFQAGRLQGLGEAKERCLKEARLTFAAHHLYANGDIRKLDQIAQAKGCDDCANAIDQLKDRT